MRDRGMVASALPKRTRNNIMVETSGCELHRKLTTGSKLPPKLSRKLLFVALHASALRPRRATIEIEFKKKKNNALTCGKYTYTHTHTYTTAGSSETVEIFRSEIVGNISKLLFESEFGRRQSLNSFDAAMLFRGKH